MHDIYFRCCSLSLRALPMPPPSPTVAEAAVPGYETSSWNGFLFPAGTRKDIVSRLNIEIVKVFNNPDFQERVQANGNTPKSSTPEEFGAFIDKERAKWAKVIRDAKIRIE